MKKIIRIILIIAVLGGGYYAYTVYQSNQTAAKTASSYTTTPITRGSLIATVGGTGTVYSNQSVEISWKTSGTVGVVNAKLGDYVKAGTVLAELDRSSLAQSLILAESDWVTAKRTLDSLYQSDLTKAQAAYNLAAAKNSLKDAQDKRDSKLYTRAVQEVIDTAYANYLLAEDALTAYKDDYDAQVWKDQTDLDRAAALSSYAKAKQTRDQALANYNYAKERPDADEVAEAEGNLQVAKAKLKDAQIEYDRVKDGVDPKDVQAAQAKLAAVEATRALVRLEAPFDGTITRVDCKAGDQVTDVTNKTTVAFRIDDFSHILIKLQITEVDISKIKVGQSVKFTFDAIPGKEFTGTVTDVSQVGETVSNVVNFDIVTELTGNREGVLPGMTSAVNIIYSQTDNILILPNRAVRTVNNRKMIYLLKNNQQVPVEVTIGATNETSTEVISDQIQEGDLAITNPTTTSFGGMGPGGGGGPPGGGGPGG